MDICRTICSHIMAGLSAIALYLMACQTFQVIEPLCRVDQPIYEIAANAPINPNPGAKRAR